MSNAATTSQGVQLQIGDGGGSEVFNLVALITNISGPSEQVERLDCTSLDSAAKQYIAGLEDGGEVSFDFWYAANNAYQQQLRTDMLAGTVRNFRIELNDSLGAAVTRIAFAAVITSHSLNMGVDAPVSASCTLKVSGAVTITPAS